MIMNEVEIYVKLAELIRNISSHQTDQNHQELIRIHCKAPGLIRTRQKSKIRWNSLHAELIEKQYNSL